MFEAFINFGYVLNYVMYLTWGNYLKEPFIYGEINASTLAPRAYLGFSGVWKAQMKALFDVRVIDTDAPSYANISSDKVVQWRNWVCTTID